MTHLVTYNELRTQGLDTKIMQRLGIDARGRELVIDGVVGPLTRGALYIDPESVDTPICREAMEDLLAGAKEEGGNNRGEWVEGYMRGGNGPWCAGSASTWLRRAHGDGAPYIRGAQRLGRKVASMSTHGRILDPHAVLEDDLMIWDRDGPDEGDDPSDDWSGHVGVAILITDQHIYTIEGNRGRHPAPVRIFRYDRDEPHMKGGPLLFAARWDR